MMHESKSSDAIASRVISVTFDLFMGRAGLAIRHFTTFRRDSLFVWLGAHVALHLGQWWLTAELILLESKGTSFACLGMSSS